MFPSFGNEYENSLPVSNSVHTLFCTDKVKYSTEVATSETLLRVSMDFNVHQLASPRTKGSNG